MGAGINLHDASADRSITAIHVIDASSVDRTIVQGRIIGPDKVDRVFWDPSGTVSFSVTISPTVTGGSSYTSIVVTGSVTATATGGTGPYSYAWSLGDFTNTTPPSVTSPSSATTTFQQTNVAVDDTDSATFTVTATDSLANTATASISVFWNHLR